MTCLAARETEPSLHLRTLHAFNTTVVADMALRYRNSGEIGVRIFRVVQATSATFPSGIQQTAGFRGENLPESEIDTHSEAHLQSRLIEILPVADTLPWVMRATDVEPTGTRPHVSYRLCMNGGKVGALRVPVAFRLMT